jgi:hypothetical protein
MGEQQPPVDQRAQLSPRSQTVAVCGRSRGWRGLGTLARTRPRARTAFRPVGLWVRDVLASSSSGANCLPRRVRFYGV